MREGEIFGSVFAVRQSDEVAKLRLAALQIDAKEYDAAIKTLDGISSPDYAALARAYGVEAERINAADDFKPALERAVASGRPYLLDVIMENAPVPTAEIGRAHV